MIEQIREKVDQDKWSGVFNILDRISNLMFKDEKSFVELFEANMPVYDETCGPREELEVFSHNDV